MSDGWSWATWAIGLVLAVGTTWWFAKRERERKILDYSITTNALLTEPGLNHFEDLEVLYHGRRMLWPRILTVEIQNAGNRAVTRSDYETPIRIECVDAEAVAARLVGCANDVDREGFELRTEASSVLVGPPLLNPGEWFTVTAVFEARSGAVNVNTRFANESRRMRAGAPARFYTERRLIRAAGRAGGSVLLATGGIVSAIIISEVGEEAALAVGAVFGAVAILSMLYFFARTLPLGKGRGFEEDPPQEE